MSDGTEAGTVVVKDISSGIGSYPGYPGGVMTSMDGVVYFLASDALAQTVWRSDGTTEGTYSVPNLGTPRITAFQDAPVFERGGFCVSDATAAGATRIAAISLRDENFIDPSIREQFLVEVGGHGPF